MRFQMVTRLTPRDLAAAANHLSDTGWHPAPCSNGDRVVVWGYNSWPEWGLAGLSLKVVALIHTAGARSCHFLLSWLHSPSSVFEPSL